MSTQIIVRCRGGDSVSVFLGYAQFISSAPLDALAEPPCMADAAASRRQRGALFRRLHERELGKRRHRELAIRPPVDRREVKESHGRRIGDGLVS